MDSTTTITNVWTFLTSIGTVEIVIVFFAIFVILTIFILITKPSFKIGNNFILFCQKSKKLVLSHSSCVHNVDFCHIVIKTTEVVTKICYIDFKECIDRQMMYVDGRIFVIKSLILNDYAKLLKNKINNNVQIMVHEDYVIYNRLVESMLLEDVKHTINLSFVNDSFGLLSHVDFEVYVNDKFEYIYQISNEFMDTWYISSKMNVTREEIRQSTLLLKPKMFQIYFDIYEKAVKILQEKEDRKKELQNELDSFFEKIVGIERKI
jgi:hypothetical protein